MSYKMPGFFFRNILTKEAIDKKIDEAKKILISKNANLDSIMPMLQSRISEFLNELAKPENKSEYDLILEQYNRFATALLQCVKHPTQTQSAINHYHSALHYYPVSINDMQKPNSTVDTILGGALYTGLVLTLLSIPAFLINPVFGAVLLGIALTCLLPSGIYFLTPDSKDTSNKKAEEKSLLESAAKVMDPEIQFVDPKNTVQYDYSLPYLELPYMHSF